MTFTRTSMANVEPLAVDALLDYAYLGVRKGPGADRHLEFRSVEARSAGNCSCQSRQGSPRRDGLRLIDRLVECFDNKIFVSGKQ